MSHWPTILHRCQKALRLLSASHPRAYPFPTGSYSRQWIHPQPVALWASQCHFVQSREDSPVGTTALRDDVLKNSVLTSYPRVVGATESKSCTQSWDHNFEKIFGWRTEEAQSEIVANGSQWVEQLLQTDGVVAMKSSWFENPYLIRRQRWPIMMLHCLTASARKTLVLLHDLPRESYMLFNMIMDCLLFLKRVYWLDILGDPVLRDLFNAVLSENRRIDRWPIPAMKQRHLDLFLEEASPHEGRQLLDDFRAAYSEPSTSAMLRFMDFLTKTDDIDGALDCLQSIPPVTLAASEGQVLARCTNLLKHDTVQKKGSSHNFDILPRMLESGIKPNLIIHNIVIKNAFRADMSGVAWDLFHFMEEQGLPTDARTYLALLKDAFLQQNTPRLNELFSAIHQRSDLFQNTHIVAYTLNIVRLVSYQKRLSPTETFSNMLPMYTRAFNAEPLKRLGLMTGEEISHTNANLPQPDARTLAFTVWSYILSQREPFVVSALWQSFQRVVQAGDASIVGMSQHDIVYNGFAIFFARKATGLSRCLAIVQHMLDTSYCKPTARTWGILLLAFVRHGRFDAAERVKNMMSIRGVKPDEDTRTLMQEQLSLSDMTSHAHRAMRRLETDVEPPQEYQMPETNPSPAPEPDEALKITNAPSFRS
jgi:pentatricopeptide repeat protein